MNTITAKNAQPARNSVAEATENTGSRNSRSGRIGSGARRSRTRKPPSSTTAAAPRPSVSAEVQRVRAPAPGGDEQQAAQRGRQQPGARVVDLRARALAARRRRQRRRDRRQRERADRQVHVEDPAPGELREHAAEQRARDAREHEHHLDVALVAAALARRHEVGDDRHRERHQPAGAEALEAAEGDQLAEALREPAQRRAEQEDRDRGLEQALAAVQVGRTTPQRDRDGGGQQVGGDDPGEPVDPAEVARRSSAAPWRRSSGRAMRAASPAAARRRSPGRSGWWW